MRGADVLIETEPAFTDDELAAINPALVHVTISAFGGDGPKADWVASDLTVVASGCALALTGDSDRPPVRTTVPQAWLHAGAEAADGALLALVERARSGRGQRVDVSAQQAMMQAGIPGVLMVPNDNPALGRTAGGILYGPVHLQFVYPALDGYVSITFLFGDTIGPYTRRLMEWVCEEGHCDVEMRDWDWDGFALRIITAEEGPAELEAAKDGHHPAHELARRRPSCSPRPSAASCCWRPSPRRPSWSPTSTSASAGTGTWWTGARARARS